MKKIVCFILTALMALMLCGCGKTTNDKLLDSEDSRFETLELGHEFRIVKHKETGVCYFFWYNGYQGGVTVMLNSDGTPYTGGER